MDMRSKQDHLNAKLRHGLDFSRSEDVADGLFVVSNLPDVVWSYCWPQSTGPTDATRPWPCSNFCSFTSIRKSMFQSEQTRSAAFCNLAQVLMASSNRRTDLAGTAVSMTSSLDFASMRCNRATWSSNMPSDRYNRSSLPPIPAWSVWGFFFMACTPMPAQDSSVLTPNCFGKEGVTTAVDDCSEGTVRPSSPSATTCGAAYLGRKIPNTVATGCSR